MVTNKLILHLKLCFYRKLANELTNIIFGFILIDENHGILLYSTDFIMLRELFLAKVYLNLETSQIEINETTKFNSHNLIKQMYGNCCNNRFVLLSEKSRTLDDCTSIFYIFSTNNIYKPLKTLKISRVNDKILFYNLIGDYIYFFDTPQVSLFKDVLFNKSLIRKLCIKTGEVETVQTSEFPDCGNFIAYGNVRIYPFFKNPFFVEALVYKWEMVGANTIFRCYFALL